MNDSVTMSERLGSSPPTSRKRSHDGTVLPISQSESRDTNGESSLPTPSSGTPSLGIGDRSRQASPAVSTTSSSLTDLTDLTGEGSKASLSAPPTKKRKLTFAEREVERAARKEKKEARERQKAEDKARRDEDKRVKDEEKRKREEEKEMARRERELDKAEKQKVKDAEKRAKEEEKQKKEEEKTKKERVSMHMDVYARLLTIDSRKCELVHSSASRKSLPHLHRVVQKMSRAACRVEDPLSSVSKTPKCETPLLRVLR
jgi:chromatin assembly factor 1 subunit A